MDITATMFLCLLSCIPKQLTGKELKKTVVPGDSITLDCSTKMATGSHGVWIKLCSDQPLQFITREFLNDHKRITLISNNGNSKDCYNLRITNITESDACSYYNGFIVQKEKDLSYTFGDIPTKMTFAAAESSSPQPSCPPPPGCRQCWVLMVSMCVVCTGLSALMASICVYCFCSRTGSQSQHHRVKITGSTHQTDQVKDLTYAALDIPACGRKPRPKKKCSTEDFVTYSDVRSLRN